MDSLNQNPTISDRNTATQNPNPSHTLSPPESKRRRHYFDLLKQWYIENSQSTDVLENPNTKPLSSEEKLKEHAATRLAELGLVETKMVGNVLKFKIPKRSTVEDISRMLRIIQEFRQEDDGVMLSDAELSEKAEQIRSLIN